MWKRRWGRHPVQQPHSRCGPPIFPTSSVPFMLWSYLYCPPPMPHSLCGPTRIAHLQGPARWSEKLSVLYEESFWFFITEQQDPLWLVPSFSFSLLRDILRGSSNSWGVLFWHSRLSEWGTQASLLIASFFSDKQATGSRHTELGWTLTQGVSSQVSNRNKRRTS